MNSETTENQVLSSGIQLSVVVPVFNEKENITPLVDEIIAIVEGRYTYEIIYVDDGSTDGTPELLASLAHRHPVFRYVCHQGNAGQSAAIVSGVAHARGQLIVTLDGDGQNDPADIPKLVSVLYRDGQEGRDNTLVVGRRRKRRDTWIRRISSRLANGVRSRLLKDATPDTGSGLKVFSRQTFLNLPRFDHMHRFLPALVMRNKGRVISIEVNHRERRRGTSKYGIHNRLWVGIVDLMGVMWLQRRAICPEIKKR
jgi:glycosyltransferase involved in cell wall biosynthesis